MNTSTSRNPSSISWQRLAGPSSIKARAFIPTDLGKSLRGSFRECILPEVFRDAVRAINRTSNDEAWPTDRQLDDLRDQLLRQPNRTLLEANETARAHLFKAG